jgi:hypothetical protein
MLNTAMGPRISLVYMCTDRDIFMHMCTKQGGSACNIFVLYSGAVQRSNNIQYATKHSEVFRGFPQ